ncbi:hypothetical protein CCACVL1_19380 [Corchorus capsularis]|uniref:Uncharacterized protein n=1 Tax=Corchorus capsularis TaxID=210143 RepID=A0A1R3HH21_COCAP|nr:hypothetical protein CCACVL1_19380 [Corchorus capsularis]
MFPCSVLHDPRSPKPKSQLGNGVGYFTALVMHFVVTLSPRSSFDIQIIPQS